LHSSSHNFERTLPSPIDQGGPTGSEAVPLSKRPLGIVYFKTPHPPALERFFSWGKKENDYSDGFFGSRIWDQVPGLVIPFWRKLSNPLISLAQDWFTT
jgi:hypothetical protein